VIQPTRGDGSAAAYRDNRTCGKYFFLNGRLTVLAYRAKHIKHNPGVSCTLKIPVAWEEKTTERRTDAVMNEKMFTCF